MKKTWKESLYDFCYWCIKFWIPVIPMVLSIFGFVLPFFIYEQINEIWLTVIVCASQALLVLTCILAAGCAFVIEYNKETFLHNKVRYLIFAREGVTVFLAIMVSAIFVTKIDSFFSEELAYVVILLGWRLLCIPIIGFASVEIGGMISECAKKKVCYIEPDDDQKSNYIV